MSDQPLWFEVEPGYLFIAPTGSELPANTTIDGVFVDSWPLGWRPVGVTNPQLCGHQVYGYDVSDIVPAADFRWTFGPELDGRIAGLTAVAPLVGIRFMTGWEAETRKGQLVASRCTIAVTGRVVLEADPAYTAHTARTAQEHSAAFGR